MSRDRLGEIRGGGQQDYSQQVQQPYSQQGSYGYQQQYQQPQGYAAQGYQQQQYQQQQHQQQQYQQPVQSTYPPAAYSRGGVLQPATSLDEFFRQSDQITNDINRIVANSEEIRNKNTRSLREVNQNVAAALKNEVEQLCNSTAQLVDLCRDNVKVLAKAKGGDANVKQTHYSNLVKKLRDAVRVFWTEQNEIKKSSRDQLARQYRIARPNASDQEINTAIESGNADVFNQQILSSRVADQQRALGAVQDRAVALRKIEQSMTELLRLTSELESLINDQQVFIDNVETHVEQTVVNAESGVRELTRANESAVAARKKKWIVFWIILVVLAVIGIAIAIYFLTQKKNN